VNTKSLTKNIVIGHLDGCSSAGQTKNEDGCIVWSNQEEGWEFALILDAHNTAQSAELVLSTFEKEKDVIYKILQFPVNGAFEHFTNLVLHTFNSKSFREACRNIQGETSCLFVIRKDKYIWWLSIGNCLLLLNHPELSALGEYQQNHRSFYEWVGQVNTFDKEFPCYSSGTKELRKAKIIFS
jgi:hypothetical protein